MIIQIRIKGLVEIVPIFHTVFALVYHYAISELCKRPVPSQWSLKRVPTSSDSPVSTTGARAPPLVEHAFLTNAAATVRSVGAVSVRA